MWASCLESLAEKARVAIGPRDSFRKLFEGTVKFFLK